jgi:hypothetical protein
MPMPKSVTRVNKKGIKFTSSVDKAQYTIEELSRAALRDSAKLIRKRMIEKLKELPGMRRSKRLYSSAQYWVRKRETDLQIGFKHDTWYGVDQEKGTRFQPSRGILKSTVMENVNEIRKIQGKYLSAIESDNKARGLIDEGEQVGDENN